MKVVLPFVCYLFSMPVFPQLYTGKVTGIVKDESNKPVEFANVILYRSVDSVLVKGAISDAGGFFEIDGVEEGNYYLGASNIGYETSTNPVFTISSIKEVANFQEFILKPDTKTLTEITVSTQKQFIERKLDKLVVNVENSIVAAGNTVLEVLQRSPGVVVNEESSINLKGKSGVMVMIDGKPSPLSGTDLITYLKSIPAANVQSIEIISNPSARYDAGGNAGIINIRFKKDKRQGFNGSATASYGQGVYPKPSANANFNLRESKWNFFGSYSYSQPQNFTYFFINRKFFDLNHNLSSNFEQVSYTKQPLIGHNSRVGVDFYVNPKTVIGLMLNGNWNGGARNGNTLATITDAGGLLNYTTKTAILLNEKRFNGFGNINFKHTVDSLGRELTADLDLGGFNSQTRQNIRNVNLSPNGNVLLDAKFASNQMGAISMRSAKVDYIHPFSPTAKFETGLKSTFVTSNNDVNFFNTVNEQNYLDTSRSNHFIYKENINAIYTSFAKQMLKFDFQAGLRVEQTVTYGKQIVTGESFSRNYINFFPNVTLNRKFKKDNSLSISYTRRIDRPSYRQLNPFKIFVDSYTYVVGDPSLKPVINGLYELNHTFNGKYITTLSYTRARQSITDVFVQDDVSKISYQVPANIQDFEQYNVGVFIPVNFKKIVHSTLSGSVYRNRYASNLQGGNLQQSFNSWDMNLNNVVTFGQSGWSAELSGYYQSKMVWGLFYIKSLAQVTAGVQKISRNKNSVFKFSVSDIFHTNHIAVVVQYQNQDFETERNWDSTVGTFSYTYRFGKSTVSKARQRLSGIEEEKRRAG